MKKMICQILVMIMLSYVLAGCGETIHGIGRDTSRIVYGVKTIFVSDNK